MKKPENGNWQVVGVCGMDTAGLLIADPCYVINRPNREPTSLEINDYSVWCNSKEEITPLLFKRGHAGAGIIIHSPNGDGSLEIWAKLDSKGHVRSVFFSFDGEIPNP